MVNHIFFVICYFTVPISAGLVPTACKDSSSCDKTTPTPEATSTTETDEPWSVYYSGYSALPTSSDPSPTAPASGPRFSPDGASPGFYCEYPTLTDWEPCNSADSRDCWLRKPDSQSDEININTDCAHEYSQPFVESPANSLNASYRRKPCKSTAWYCPGSEYLIKN